MTRQPNILLIMMDQLAPQVLKPYGGSVCRTPNIERLADEGVVFEKAYCNYPICAPARAAFMSGRLPSRVGSYDNACEFRSETPTLAHYLRAMGYRTCLSGKMHFVGADQLHGFEDRTTPDVYPANFLWTGDWTRDLKTSKPTYPTVQQVCDAGPARRSVNTAYDEEVTEETCRWLHDHADRSEERPFFLTASFISPHDPYHAPPSHWNLYSDDEIDEPRVPDIPEERCDAHSRRLFYSMGRHVYDVGPDDVLRARRAYYAVMSWLDDRIGRVLETVEAIGEKDNTIIVVTADHGEMLGERGMWFKMNFFEWSVRIPMIIHAPAIFQARRVSENVSLVDLLPTFLEWAGDGALPPLFAPIDGTSLTGLASGCRDGWPDIALSEYCSQGAVEPLFMVSKGKWKLIHGENDPPLLFNLEEDPDELENRAGCPDTADVEKSLRAELYRQWNPCQLRNQVIDSQRRRLFLRKALATGRVTHWDWNPTWSATRRFSYDLSDMT